jgi:hypothetical protein
VSGTGPRKQDDRVVGRAGSLVQTMALTLSWATVGLQEGVHHRFNGGGEREGGYVRAEAIRVCPSAATRA